MQSTRSFLLTPVAACLCAGFVVSAHAQLLDELEWRQEGSDAVAVIEFVTPVQYTKSISARASDLVQAFYTVLPTREALSLASSEQRLPGGGGIPSIIVRDEAASATTVNDVRRKLVIRFDKPTRFKVRAGRKPKSIEVVLAGLGPLLDAVAVKTNKVLPVPVAPVAQAESVPSASTAPAATGVDATAAALLAKAQAAFDGGQYDAATESLNQLLNLPPNNSSRKAQELAGLARLNAGDNTRAASEFGLFLKLYPEGVDSDRIKQLLASLPAPGAVAQTENKPAEEAKGVVSGSISMFYYGGRTSDQTQQEAYDATGIRLTPNAVPGVLSDQKQLQTSLDLAWRLRDAEKDMRFVLRDSLTNDFVKTKDKDKERLTALYFDYKSLTKGGSVRVGRQSPSGGGVMYRFDGVQAGYIFKPKWKVNAVLGTPSDDLVGTKRSFYGMSVDAEALTNELSGSAFLIEQKIDGETDRRGLGADLRYFKGGLSASAQLDYDLMLNKLNVAAFQTTWQITEATTVNAMFDRRTSPLLSLGNSIFYTFNDATGAPMPPATRLQDRLNLFPIEALRQRVIDETPYQNQFQVGATTTLSANWQTGANFSLSSTDAIPGFVFNGAPVAGQAATGNQWGVSAQLIGTNLYSSRDTHVFNIGFSGGVNDHSTLLTYNNLTSLGDKWQVEPSLKYMTMSSSLSGDTDSLTAGVRGIYRVRNQVSIETELTYEKRQNVSLPDAAGVVTTTSTNGMTYYLGARYEF